MARRLLVQQSVNVHIGLCGDVHLAVSNRGDGELYGGAGHVARSGLVAVVKLGCNIGSVISMKHGRGSALHFPLCLDGPNNPVGGAIG